MIDWQKYGFTCPDYDGLYVYEKHEEFPFALYESGGFLEVYVGRDTDQLVSGGVITATNQSVVLLLKAFGVKREKS